MDFSAISSSPSFPNAQPFFGIVENTIHALRLVQAARQGIIPRIIRRLNDSERREMITSGAVFVFSVEESGIKRWTDSMCWSPSRIVGNFLVYKEMWERSGGRAGQRKAYALEQNSRWNEQDASAAAQGSPKVNGLIKKTITVTIDGSDLHLVSYYTQQDLQSRRLRRISSRPDIATLQLQPRLFRFSSFRNPPKVVTSSDGQTTIVCEPEEPEPSTSETVTAQSPHSSSYSPDWPNNAMEGGMSHQSLASNQSFARGRRATIPSDPFLKDGMQGQPNSTGMAPQENRGQIRYPSTALPQMEHGQVGHSGADAQLHNWPQSAPARYDSMPAQFSPYHYSSNGEVNERDARFGGQGMMTTMRDEHAPMFGDHTNYMAQDRQFGYEHPQAPWLSTNQNSVQLFGIQNSFSPPGPSSPANVSRFPLRHDQENPDVGWSAKHNDASTLFEIEHHYSESDTFPNASQAYSPSMYGSKQSADGQLYNGYEGRYVSHRDTGGN